MAATVIVPPSTGKAIALMTSSLRMHIPTAEHLLTIPEAFPSIGSLELSLKTARTA
jgi:hypothetical protein